MNGINKTLSEGNQRAGDLMGVPAPSPERSFYDDVRLAWIKFRAGASDDS